ncbi:MAG: PepSY domain-containing protein [Nitrosomonas sp.]|nr:PepSY domain-containing protein [Nitrosomonas sp.]MCW5607054.1 PepSY domain-containing protein [Nitrosomonas sp.]
MNKLTIFFLIVFLLVVSPVLAQTSGETRSIYRDQVVDQHSEISQRKAIAIAQKYIKGRVLDIKQHGDIYRVKILSEKGSVHIVQVNAIDGEIITGH